MRWLYFVSYYACLSLTLTEPHLSSAWCCQLIFFTPPFLRSTKSPTVNSALHGAHLLPSSSRTFWSDMQEVELEYRYHSHSRSPADTAVGLDLSHPILPTKWMASSLLRKGSDEELLDAYKSIWRYLLLLSSAGHTCPKNVLVEPVPVRFGSGKEKVNNSHIDIVWCLRGISLHEPMLPMMMCCWLYSSVEVYNYNVESN